MSQISSFEEGGYLDALPGKNKNLFALLGLMCRRGLLAVRFRVGLLRLKAHAALLPLRSSRLGLRVLRTKKALEGWGNHFRLSWGLALCAIAAVSAVLLSALVYGAPELRGLNGTALPAESLLILDPDRSVETKLTPGYLYDRPVAAVQTGTQPMLLRVRLEESLLTIRRDNKGLVVEPLPTLNPGDTYTPRFVTQETALRLLAEGGFCKKGVPWAQAVKAKLPAERLPKTGAPKAKLLVFEKKTVENPIDASIDLSSLLPEDLEALGVNKVTYSYMGFYDRGGGKYQPLYIASADPAKGSDATPTLAKISYQYYAWDVADEKVRLYEGDENQAVRLGMPGLRPLRDWKEPTKAWFYDEDGWLYYGDVLQAGEMTPLLLSNFYVLPDSPLAGVEENRFRLQVRQQSVALDMKATFDANRKAVRAVWDTHTAFYGLGTNQMSQTSADFALKLLGGLGLK